LTAALAVFEFVAVVSSNGNYAYVAFAAAWQQTFDPLREYPSARPAELAADRLNAALALGGAAAGAGAGFAAGWFVRRTRA
jgi:hypothetical protein